MNDSKFPTNGGRMKPGTFVEALIADVDATCGPFTALSVAARSSTEQENWHTVCAAILMLRFDPPEYGRLLALVSAEVAGEPWTYDRAHPDIATTEELAPALSAFAVAQWFLLVREALDHIYRQDLPPGLEPEHVRYQTTLALIEAGPPDDDVAIGLATQIAWHQRQHQRTPGSGTPI